MHSVLFTLFGIKVHSYGLMIDIGIMSALIFLLIHCPRYKISKDAVTDLMILTVLPSDAPPFAAE